MPAYRRLALLLGPRTLTRSFANPIAPPASLGPALALPLALALATPAVSGAQESYAMRAECKGAVRNSPESRAAAERFVSQRLQAFVPKPEQSLRLKSLELQAQQVLNAFYGINVTCEQYLYGKMPQADADRSLSGYERTIADFLHDLGSETSVLAARGQVTDMEAIRKQMTDVGTTARQSALAGEEELAEEARQKLVNAVVTFSGAFREACFDQTFDPRIAMALERQNELLGTGIDVTPCANRKFSADGTGGEIVWHFTHCGPGYGDWKIETSGPLTGKGTGSIAPDLKGTWSVAEDNPERDVRVTYSGNLSLTMKPRQGPDDVPVIDQLFVQATESTVTSAGEVFRTPVDLSGLRFVVKASDKPCRPEEESH